MRIDGLDFLFLPRGSAKEKRNLGKAWEQRASRRQVDHAIDQLMSRLADDQFLDSRIEKILIGNPGELLSQMK